MYQLGSWTDPFITNSIDEVIAGGKRIKGPLYEIGRIHFQSNTSSLDIKDKQRLKNLVSVYLPVLYSWPISVQFYIIGYADQRGNSLYNMDLSQKRADSVGNYLEKLFSVTYSYENSYIPKFENIGDGEKSDEESTRLSLSQREVLARWRRVSIYSNLSGDPIKAAMRRIDEKLRKAVNNATSKFPKQLEGIQRLLNLYKNRAAMKHDSAVLYNDSIYWLSYYETRLKVRLKKYEELKKALTQGDIDKAFMEWMNSPDLPNKEFYRQFKNKLKKIITWLMLEKKKATPERQKIIQEVIDGIEDDIRNKDN